MENVECRSWFPEGRDVRNIIGRSSEEGQWPMEAWKMIGEKTMADGNLEDDRLS